MPEGPQAVLYAEGTVTYPPEMGIPDQNFVMRSSNHPENGQPDGGGAEASASGHVSPEPDLFTRDIEGSYHPLVVEDRPSDEQLKEISLAHGEMHEAMGQRAEDCPGPDCSWWDAGDSV